MKQKLNILFVSEYFYPRKAGGEVWAWELCRELARRGHQITVLTTNHADLPKKEVVEKVEILRLLGNRSGIGERLLRYFRIKSFISEARKYLESHKPDIIHTMAYGVSKDISQIAKESGIPSITSVHSYFGKDWKYELHMPFIVQQMEKSILKNDQSQIMHVPSAYLQKRIKKEVGKDTVVIHNWIPDRFPKPKKLPKNTLLFVGSLEPIKNPLACIPVAKRLNAPLFVIGKGSLEKKLLAEAAKQDIALVLIPEASHEETLSYIGGASLVLVPSITESFSLVALEAVAQGTPVSGTPVGILPELPIVPLPLQKVPGRVTTAQQHLRSAFAKRRIIDEFEKSFLNLVRKS